MCLLGNDSDERPLGSQKPTEHRQRKGLPLKPLSFVSFLPLFWFAQGNMQIHKYFAFIFSELLFLKKKKKHKKNNHAKKNKPKGIKV